MQELEKIQLSKFIPLNGSFIIQKKQGKKSKRYLLEQIHEMSDKVPLAQQQVSPHSLQVLQQQVVPVEDIQQVFTGVKVGGVNLLLKCPLQV